MNPTNSSVGHFPKKYSTSFVFNDTISRLFIILAELHNIEELNQKTLLPYLFTNKPTPLTFNYRVGEITSLDYSKKITWILDPCVLAKTKRASNTDSLSLGRLLNVSIQPPT